MSNIFIKTNDKINKKTLEINNLRFYIKGKGAKSLLPCKIKSKGIKKMTKLQKLLFTLLIAGSTQSWASEEIDFSGMDQKAAKGVFLKILQDGDYEASKAVIKRLFSQNPTFGDAFAQTAIRNVANNEELIALIRARGADEVTPAISTSSVVMEDESKEEVRAPIPAIRDVLVGGGDEVNFDFAQACSIGSQDVNEYNNNVFLSAIDRGGVWEALELLSDSSKRPQEHILKHALGKSEYLRGSMIDIMSSFDIEQSYLNIIYGIDDSSSLPSSVEAVLQVPVLGFEQDVDPELQAEIDSGFTMAIYAQPEMVEMYLEGAFGCAPSRSVIENTLITLRREDPSSALIGLLDVYLK